MVNIAEIVDEIATMWRYVELRRRKSPLLQQQKLPINLRWVRKIPHIFTTSMV
jgi:hypothetical protein